VKAAVMEKQREPLVVREVEEPSCAPDGAIVRVEANGVCRSDWHAWQGDWDWFGVNPPLPHVLGHEFAGVVEEVGSEVRHHSAGERVVVPFNVADGTCPECVAGHHNVCDNIGLIGFTQWGSFGRYVHVPHADVNLVDLPESVGFVEAASIGCRFMTAFHGLADQAQVRPGEWVAVHGCGGVGLSATMIATALGAGVIAVDIDDRKLDFAREIGAVETVNARETDAARAVQEITGGGAHVSVDALGIAQTCQASVGSVRKRGRHLQIGLTTSAERGVVGLPVDLIVQKEIRLIGSLGMGPVSYPYMLSMIEQGKLSPKRLVSRTIPIEEAGDVLASMGDFGTLGVVVVDRW